MKKFLSITVVIALALSLTIPALANTDGGVLTGDTTVESVVLQVVVPTSLPLGLDPLAINDRDSQVIEAPLNIINNTPGVKVLAAFYLEADLDDEVELVASSELDEKYLIGSTDKKIFLGIKAAKEFDDGAPVFAGGAIRAFTENANNDIVLDFGFVLDAFIPAVTEPVPADAIPGADAFVFHGEMNAYAKWEKSDIEISGVYLLKALSVNTTVAITTDTVGLVATSVTLPEKPDPESFEPPAPIGFTAASGLGGVAGATNSREYTYSRSDAPATLVIPFNFDGKTITSFKTPSGTDLVLGTDYTVQANSITILNARLAAISVGAKLFPIVIDGKTFNWSVNPAA